MKIAKKFSLGAKALALLASSFLLFGTTACSNDDEGEPTPSPEPSIPASTDMLYMLNASGTATVDGVADTDITSGVTLTEDATITGFGNNAFLLYKLPVNSTSNATLTADISFKTSINNGGIGIVETDGASILSYSLGTNQGVKTINNDGGTSVGAGGNGFTAVGGFAFVNDTFYHATVSIADGKITFTFAESDTVYTSRGHAYSTKYNDDSTLFMAVGGIDSSNVTIKNIKVNGSPVTKLAYNQLPSLTVTPAGDTDSLAPSIKTEGTATYTVVATNAGENVEFTAVSADTNIATVAVSGATVTITGGVPGDTIVTIKNETDALLKLAKVIKVNVANYPEQNGDYSLSNATYAYPASGSSSAYTDDILRLTFDAAPQINRSNYICIYKHTDSGDELVDKIKFAEETLDVWEGVTLNVDEQLARVEGNAVYFTPHYDKLVAGVTYFVAIPDGAITGKINGVNFTGLSKTYDATSGWNFTTKTEGSVGAEVTVSSKETDSPDFRTIGRVLRRIGSSNSGNFTIKVAKGTQRELLYFKGSAKANITIVGDTTTAYGSDVVVAFANGNKLNATEKGRNLFEIEAGGNFTFKNITFKNTYSRANYSGDAQAECIGHDASGNIAAYNCSFISHQDTLRTVAKAWFYKCHIEGDVDFLWMEQSGVVALYEVCEIKSTYDENQKTHGTYIVAPRVTRATQIGKGLVVLNSTLEVENKQPTYLGRNPWGTDSSIYNNAAFINFTVKSGELTKKDGSYWYSAANGTTDQKYVGWKTDAALASTGAGTLDATLINAEYASRGYILNRLIDLSAATPTYVTDKDGWWDVSEFGWADETSSPTNNPTDFTPIANNGSWLVDITADGTYTDGDLSVTVAGTNGNDHGAEVKNDGTSSVTITLPAGSYILDAGTCKYGDAKEYKLECSNADFMQEYIGTHTYATEDCYKAGRTDLLYGDIFMIKSAETMSIKLNSDSVKEYLPFIKVVKTPTYQVDITADGTYTDGDLSVTVAGTNGNDHGAEVKNDGTSSVTITLPAGSYILDAGTCKYGDAKEYKLECSNADFMQEYIGTHTYATEDCYKAGRTDLLYGDIFMIKSADAMSIKLNSDSVKEYLPFIAVIK